jgi:hypothetical protein
MDETRLKPIRPYNIILFAQYGKEAKGNIPTCENRHLGSLGIFLSKGSLQLLEVTS